MNARSYRIDKIPGNKPIFSGLEDYNEGTSRSASKAFCRSSGRSLLILLFYPFLHSAVLHELQVFDDFFMVPDAVHLVDSGKILQAPAWEFRALEAPGYLLLLDATAEAVAAVPAGGIDMIGKASVATNLFDGDFISLGHLLQFILILILIGQVFGQSRSKDRRFQPTDCLAFSSHLLKCLTN